MAAIAEAIRADLFGSGCERDRDGQVNVCNRVEAIRLLRRTTTDPASQQKNPKSLNN